MLSLINQKGRTRMSDPHKLFAGKSARATHKTYATVLSFPGRKWYGGQGPLTEISQFFSCFTALLHRF